MVEVAGVEGRSGHSGRRRAAGFGVRTSPRRVRWDPVFARLVEGADLDLVPGELVGCLLGRIRRRTAGTVLLRGGVTFGWPGS